jgi:cation:H+ antiporter
MSISSAVAVFLGCLTISIVSSLVMAKRIEQLGTWLRLSEGLLGLLTALASDTPEIASAITAIVAGNRDLGLGVVFGSNIFNLAALLGAGAITAGCIRVGRAGLWFDGGVGLVVAVIVAVRLFGWIGSAWAVVLICVVLVPYLLISAIKPEQLEHMPAHPRLRAALHHIMAATAHEKRKDLTPEKPSAIDLLAVVPSLVAVVVASVGMVNSAVVLGNHLGISHVVIGMLVLATLTGIPNALSGIRLALRGRGTVVVSETLNSNNVNLLVGALLPVLIFGTGKLTSSTEMAIAWSIAMTALALVLTSFHDGLTRRRGIVLVVVYVAFAVVLLIW